MDPTIQSQIQSPLVRTLQSIPTNSSNFVHGIPDNTPPFSKSSITIQPYAGNAANLNSVFKFKIPQGGHLNRALLRYRMIGNRDDGNDVLQHNGDTPFAFGNGIVKIELRARTDIVETIYPTSLPFESLSQVQGEQMGKNVLIGCAGYKGIDGIGVSAAVLSPPRYQVTLNGQSTNAFTDNGENMIQDFLIPIPFSSTFYMKDNFQTRLLEDLEVLVYTRPSVIQVAGGNSRTPYPAEFLPTNRHELELRADFINFHENVEEVIRNENFKPNVPAALLQNDRLNFRAKHVSTSTSGDIATLVYEAELTCDALATDLYIAPMVHPASNIYEHYHLLERVGVNFELKSQTDTIISGSKAEFDGILSQNYSTVTRQFQNEGVLPLRWASSGTHIRLGLNNTDEFFDGGISFQSLNNPKLIITVTTDTTADFNLEVDEDGDQANVALADNPTLLEFDVVLKRKVMLRIDGNTGKISKSLES